MKRLGLAAVLLLAGCGNGAPEGATLRVAVVGTPGAGLAARLEAEATGPTLIARDGSGQIVPGLATSWRFVDEGRSLILRLRPVSWSNGAPLTSADVVAAMRRAALRREPAIIDSGLTAAAAVAARRAGPNRLGVLAPIARVVELRLDAASPLLLDWLAEPALAVTRTGKTPPTLAGYVASGPPQRRVLTRRSRQAAPDQRPAEIIITAATDSAAAITAFARGDTDIVFGDGLAGLGNARTEARADALRIDPLFGVYGYTINPRRGALADPAVRRALTLAIDRAALVSQFGINALVPIEGLRPPATNAAARAAEPSAPDLGARQDEARRLLAEAGYSPAHPLRLVLLLPPGRDHRVIAEIAGRDLAAIGVVLAVSEVGDIDRRVAAGDFDLAVTEMHIAAADGGALLARWRCDRGLACNPAADALLDAARRALPADRPALLDEAEAALMTGPPMIALFRPVRWALVARGVDGWTPNMSGSHPLARLDVARR
jgi:oligopeptide transport system substrate-binding protein